MPDGRLRVGSVIAEDDVVVFTVTAKRSEVRAAVAPGDQLRISRGTGEVEIAPRGIPGVIDRLGEELRELKERFCGGRRGGQAGSGTGSASRARPRGAWMRRARATATKPASAAEMNMRW